MSSEKYTMRQSRRISIIAIMASLALVGNYALIAVPNVELGTTILFVTAYIFGFTIAAWSVIIMSIVFSVINPWGAFVFQIWIAQVAGWLFISAAGAIMKDQSPEEYHIPNGDIGLMIVGAFLTAFFDLVTNLGYAWAFSVPYGLAIITGFPFMIVHIISNAILFGGVVPILNHIVRHHFALTLWESVPDYIEVWSEE